LPQCKAAHSISRRLPYCGFSIPFPLSPLALGAAFAADPNMRSADEYPPSVLLVERVSPLAMRSPRSAARFAPSDVLAAGHRLQVVRVDAAPDSAQVVHVETLRNVPPPCLVGNAVSTDTSTTHLYLSVSIWRDVAAPNPAAIRLNSDELHDAVLYRPRHPSIVRAF
jgi:hypothetical protein